MGLSYNGNNLQTPNILTKDIDHLSAPDNDISIFSVAHGNRSSITNTEYHKRQITISGIIQSTSLTTFETLRDTFMGYFVGYDQNLDIDYAGSTRRYTATAQSVNIDRPNGLLWANFTVTFVCSNPFGIATSSSTILNLTAQTTSPATNAVTFGGTAPYQLPTTTVTFSALDMNGFTTRTVSIGNAATGQQINVTRGWSASDILIVDSATKSVKVNGVPYDFTGGFPEFGPGAQNITYSDNFASRTYSMLSLVTPRYI